MKYLIIICLFLYGCGSGEVLVTYETVDREFLDAICTEEYRCDGYAIWNHTLPQRTCTIYLLTTDHYYSWPYYYQIRGHESRHCEEGAFH